MPRAVKYTGTEPFDLGSIPEIQMTGIVEPDEILSLHPLVAMKLLDTESWEHVQGPERMQLTHEIDR